MRVRITPRARADIEDIGQYLRKLSPSGATNVLRSIHSTIGFIGENPRAAAQDTDEPSVRMKLVIHYPYKIFYRIHPNAIEILHVRHASRQPWTRDLG